MGKPNSYMFCRMHDLKSVFFEDNGDFKVITLSLTIPDIFERFTILYPNFSKNDAVLAVCHMMINFEDDERLVKYRRYAEQYGVDNLSLAMEAILNQNEELDRILEANPNDTTIIYVMSFCLGTYGRNSDDAMGAAYGLMNRILEMEERGTIDVDKELTSWVTLACYIGFEEAHDQTYGSPIIGNSPFNNKDKYGNPIKKDNDSNSYHGGGSTQSSTGGGCYVATAVYGSYDCPEVWTLRRYRDYKLASTWYGRTFIRVYYATSPTLVKWFGNTNWFNRIFKSVLDQKIRKLKEIGYESTSYSDKEL